MGEMGGGDGARLWPPAGIGATRGSVDPSPSWGTKMVAAGGGEQGPCWRDMTPRAAGASWGLLCWVFLDVEQAGLVPLQEPWGFAILFFPSLLPNSAAT